MELSDSKHALQENTLKLPITYDEIQHINAQSIIGPEGANDSIVRLYAKEYKEPIYMRCNANVQIIKLSYSKLKGRSESSFLTCL